MDKRKSRLGWILIVLLFLLLLVFGGIWFLGSMGGRVNSTPPSPVLVFITDPASGDEVSAGDFVTIAVKATAPSAIQSTELFMDGRSLGKLSSKVTTSAKEASWTWQAWPVGAHSFEARSTTLDGQVGESQTVIINVLAANGPLQVIAKEGESLELIGIKYGVPPDQMAGANPQTDPSQPLPGGQPVEVPVGNGGSGNGSGPGSGGAQLTGGNFPVVLVTWQFKPTQPVDKSYCYTSTGDGKWEKMPKEPFEFFAGDVSFYTQVSFDFVNQFGLIQMQCWGWVGGSLIYLGQGETAFDAQNPPDELTVVGNDFVLTGVPEIPPESGGGAAIPPPYGLREPKDSAECLAHGQDAFYICQTLMNAPVKEYAILVWEWAPEACWPGYCQYDVTQIEGYHIYQVDPFTLNLTYLKQVKGASNKVAAVPLPWGPTCYSVDAYVDSGVGTSEIAIYCPSELPQPKKTTLTEIENWLTAVNMFEQGDDCNGVDDGFYEKPSAVGEVFVGGYEVDSDYTDCNEDVIYTGAIKFKIPVSLLPSTAVVQKADMKTRMFLWFASLSLLLIGCSNSSKVTATAQPLPATPNFQQVEIVAPVTSAPDLPEVFVTDSPADLAAVSVIASASLPDSLPTNVRDGNPEIIWNSGSDPQQWIQFDFGAPVSVSLIRLLVSQYPEGETIHQVWVGADPNNLALIHEFSGATFDGQVLEFIPAAPLINIQFIKIFTVQGPSWVAWREIEIVP